MAGAVCVVMVEVVESTLKLYVGCQRVEAQGQVKWPAAHVCRHVGPANEASCRQSNREQLGTPVGDRGQAKTASTVEGGFPVYGPVCRCRPYLWSPRMRFSAARFCLTGKGWAWRSTDKEKTEWKSLPRMRSVRAGVQDTSIRTNSMQRQKLGSKQSQSWPEREREREDDVFALGAEPDPLSATAHFRRMTVLCQPEGATFTVP